ncbi:MAG TPA: hypothetical protein VH420_03320 [Gaiellaceae bacterium]
MALTFSDEFEHGFGWSPENDRISRTSHAIRSGGRVWLIDTVDGPGLDERIRQLGEPAGVVQLLDRHERDCAAISARLRVPLHVLEAPDGLESRRILDLRFWKEIALWFPDERILVCADALGSLGYFRAKGEPFGITPLLRLFPPRRALAGLEPEHILFGHGPGAHGPETPAQLAEALATSRRRLPQALLRGVREPFGPSSP